MIPNTLRVPFTYVEIDPSKANQGSAPLKFKALLIGQRLATGSVTTTRIDTLKEGQAAAMYGAGSMLAMMADAWFANNRQTEVYAVSLADNGAGVVATGTFAFTGPSTAAGTLVVYIAGKRIAVAVASGDAATAIGDALVAAITADTSLPVTAANNSGTVTCTAKNKGTVGNDIDLRINYNAGEALPAGVACTVTGMASGATDPALSGVVSILGDAWYNIIACPYTDATNMSAIETELADRYDYDRMIDGLYVTAKKATQANMATFGNGRNSPHVTCLACYKFLNTTAEVSAAYAAVIALYGEADSNPNLSTVELKNILAPAPTERFTFTENNTMLFDGIATYQVDAAGKVRIQRAITMYQLNDSGAVDEAYLEVATKLNIQYLRYSLRTRIQTKYARAKLANDGTNIRAGISVITPSIAKAECVAWFRQMEGLGLVENAEQFKNDLVVTRDADNPNRLNILLAPDLVNLFYIGAAIIQFRL